MGVDLLSGNKKKRNNNQKDFENKPKNNEVQGMGLEDKAKKKKEPERSNREVAQSGKDTAEGVAQTGKGVAKVKSGNIKGGAKDIVEGAKKTKDGLEDLNQDLEDKGIDLSDDKLGDNKSGRRSGKEKPTQKPNDNKPSQIQDPYNSDSYESVFGDDEDSLNDPIYDDDEGSSDSVFGDEDDDKDSLYDSDEDDDGDGESKDSVYDDDGVKDKDGKKKDSLGKKVMKAQSTAKTVSSGMKLYRWAKILQWLKAMAVNAVKMASSLWASFMGGLKALGATIMSGIQTGIGFIASMTGFSAMTSGALLAASVGMGVTAIGGVVSTIMSPNGRRDDALVCEPTNTRVSDATFDWEQTGNTSEEKKRTIQKAWSVFSELGLSEYAAAGVLGNFDAESGIDPTVVETIYTEPYAVGPKTQAAYDADFNSAVVAPTYKYSVVNGGAVDRLGVGIGQWSNGRNKTIKDYAEERDLDLFDIGTQLTFMFDGDNPSDVDILWDISENASSIDEAATRFVDEWERPDQGERNKTLSKRIESAARIYLDIETMDVDKEYAESILSGMNIDGANTNHHRSEYFQDDGCGETVSKHYQGAADGTGVFPESAGGPRWKPDDLPSSLNEYIIDPEEVGMKYGSSEGWADNIISDQCVAFSDSFFKAVYGLDHPMGNGGELANNWYERYHKQYGGTLSRVPAKGAMFSYENSGVYGHTGIVQHVFANGDLLIAEQNQSGYSGAGNNTHYTWNYRHVRVAEYEKDTEATRNWQFYKPDMEASWESDSK